jgi:hypothetical protein
VLWDGAASFDRIYNGFDTNADQLLIGAARPSVPGPGPTGPPRVASRAGVVTLMLMAAPPRGARSGG